MRALKMLVVDTHAEPLACAGDVVMYDGADCQPTAGQLYVTLSDRGKSHVMMCQRVGNEYYAALPNYRKLRKKPIGPMKGDFFKSHILGRVVSVVSVSQHGGTA